MDVAGGFSGVSWLGALMGARFHLQSLSGALLTAEWVVSITGPGLF